VAAVLVSDNPLHRNSRGISTLKAFPLKSTFITVNCSYSKFGTGPVNELFDKIKASSQHGSISDETVPIKLLLLVSKRLHNGWSNYISFEIVPDIPNSDNVTFSAIPVLISHSIPSRLQILSLLSFWNKLLGIQGVFPPVSSYTTFCATAYICCVFNAMEVGIEVGKDDWNNDGEKLGCLEGIDDKRAVGIEVRCIDGCKDCKILGNVERSFDGSVDAYNLRAMVKRWWHSAGM